MNTEIRQNHSHLNLDSILYGTDIDPNQMAAEMLGTALGSYAADRITHKHEQYEKQQAAKRGATIMGEDIDPNQMAAEMLGTALGSYAADRITHKHEKYKAQQA